MPELTDHYGLVALEPGDSLSAFGYGFLSDNIHKIDRLIKSMTTHDHTGTQVAQVDPVDPPVLVLDTTEGNVPAGTTVRYRYTYVDQNGFETAGSPEALVETADVVQRPGAPDGLPSSSGGALLGGVYSYALTAYVGSSTQETVIGLRTNTSVSYATSVNAITLNMPSLPDGATGFNIYRRGPGEAYYSYLTSTTDATFVDTGVLNPNFSRQPPNTNLTNGTNNVMVSLPSGVPAGGTWKIYRSYAAGNWTASDLHHVAEETSAGSGVIVDQFQDFGFGTGLKSVPEASEIAQVPSKIGPDELEDVYATPQPINPQTGTTYTLVLSDAGKLVTLSNGAAVTLTVPPNSSVAFPVGTRIDLAQLGAGAVTVTGGAGVTVNGAASLTFAGGAYSSASLVKLAENAWLATGQFA